LQEEDEDVEDAGAVVDVLANLTSLSRAKGEIGTVVDSEAQATPVNPVETARNVG
jgi:hypothetical protein